MIKSVVLLIICEYASDTMLNARKKFMKLEIWFKLFF